ncbi:hypothetical protein CK203_076804 [Vitis vinifera]|uniref:Reverse transcriptase zinc-binding domain-containing protein n=1 Tax=Vitis vinifera TaxID=29760 RepID=A0A438ET43_VITVI|nr:hypothetical protein CK203_076804 [Vitis vinifera]
MKFKVGRGTKIMFWTDHWCGNEALSQAFPQIFALAVCSNELVNDVWDPRLGQGGWNLRLVRDSNDWELVLIEDLLFLLRDIRVTLKEDSVLWKGGILPVFGFGWLTIFWQPLILLFFQEKIFGWIRSQPKWLFLRGRLLGKNPHWLGPFGKSPLPYLGFSGCFQRKSKRRCSVGGALLWVKKEEDMEDHSVMYFWTVWKERNRLAFRGSLLAIQTLKNSFVCSLWSWAKLYRGEESSSLLGFLEWVAVP